jgi:putative methyltransferase (TIGR04325 family)
MMTNVIFSGCTQEWNELPQQYDANEVLERHVDQQVLEVVNLLSAQFPVMLESRLWGSAILPSIISTMVDEAREPISIIDFGGGGGKKFVEIIRALDNPYLINGIRYWLIEMPAFCKKIESFLKQVFEIFYGKVFNFSDQLPQEKVDVVSCTSSLQYIKDYKALIGELLSKNPKVFLIINTPINNQQTYCRTQLNLMVPISQWVFGLPDLDAIFTDAGYRRKYFAVHQQEHLAVDTPAGTFTNQSTAIYQR